MKRAADWEQKTLINELTQGKELAKQLRSQLNASSPLETRQSLLERIICSYEKSLSMLNWADLADEQKPTVTVLEAPRSIVKSNKSPKGDASKSNKDWKESKKRKAQPRLTEQVRICSGSGPEGPFDDGYSWRKYGQKDILGSNFPRAYYRCTHRPSQGCLALKQVQKSDEDPTIFEVTYRGRHTCVQAYRPAATSWPYTLNATSVQEEAQRQQQIDPKRPNSSADALVTFGEQPETKSSSSSKDLGSDMKDIFPSFSFTATGVENEEYNNIFLDPMMENNFLDSLSPSFVSPTTTSESNFFSVSPCHLNNFGVADNVRTPESDLTDIISTPTSLTDSPMEDLDLSNLDFAANFPSDCQEFLLDQ